MTTAKAELGNNTPIDTRKLTNNAEKQLNYAELIHALTPIIIAIIGGLIGVFAILSHDIDSNKLTAAMGLAGTALAGASGLAQQSSTAARK